MDCSNIVNLALVVLSLAAFCLVITSKYSRRRPTSFCSYARNPCYLQSDKGKEEKPQVSFKRVLADNSFSKFKHLVMSDQSNSDNGHPYAWEINGLLEGSSVGCLERGIEGNADNRAEMSELYDWVDSRSKLKEVADALSEEIVFAVDTEQHSLRSFLGFTALVQVSTKSKDYLIDTIKLHDEMDLLAPVFANPRICKVFHGADNDILWLQRDFYIYVVNLFDTAKACEVLSKPQKSLAYLLETYCGVSTDKSFQREDWRQRPLSPEMVIYARSDAHYLLYIAARLISELKRFTNDNSCSLDVNRTSPLKEACRRSNMISLQLYSKETESMPGEVAATSIISRQCYGHGNLSNEKQNLIRRISMWRELMARVHDESLRYVLSDEAITLLSARVPKTEGELSNILAEENARSCSINNNVSLSPVICSHSNELLSILHENDFDCESKFWMLLEEHLGPNGGCPISVYNYALRFTSSLHHRRNLKTNHNYSNVAKQNYRRESRELFVKKFSCKTPVYHNCRIFANDGRLLCFCDRRKLEWYVERKLACIIDENPPAIRLLFEPKGRPEDEGNDFYIHSKKNICVCCGEGSHYLRYRIIPSCYRMHFPEHLKSHRSHDIVLLCVDCHEVAHAAAERFKKEISSEFGIPLFIGKVVESEKLEEMEEDDVGVSPVQLRTAAMALLRHGSRMPSARRMQLTEVVSRYFGGKEVTEDDLERAIVEGMTPHGRRKFAKKKGSYSTPHGGEPPIPKFKNTLNSSLLGHGPHGNQVVNRILGERGEHGLAQFSQRWRKVFVDSTNPRFLPSGWDIMHSGKRDFGDFSVYKKPLL